MGNEVRSRRLAGPLLLSSADASVYVVPSGRTAVVRTILLHNTHSATVNVFLSLNATATVAASFLTALAIPVNTTVKLESWMALDPGDEIRSLAGTNNVVRATLFGALLDGVPT